MLSVIPDIDILIPFLQHRGPTHSILSSIMLFLPAFVIWRRKALPYFFALLQHSLVGDYLGGGGLQLLWPLTKATYGLRIDIKGATNVVIELIAFLVAMLIMLRTKDMSKLFEARASNLILVIPVVTVVLPTLLAYPFYVPLVLMIPHVTYLAIFLISILAYVRRSKPTRGSSEKRPLPDAHLNKPKHAKPQILPSRNSLPALSYLTLLIQKLPGPSHLLFLLYERKAFSNLSGFFKCM